MLVLLLATTDQQVANATRLAAWASIAVAAATAMLAFFTWRLARQARRSAGDAEAALAVAQKQADAAVIQAQTARTSLRASSFAPLAIAADPHIEHRPEECVVVSASVYSVGPGAAKIERAVLVTVEELELRAGVGLVFGGQTGKLTAVIPATHPVVTALDEKTAWRLDVYFCDIMDEQHQSAPRRVELERTRDVLVDNAGLGRRERDDACPTR